MRIIAKRTLRRFWEANPRAEQPLRRWFDVASRAEWKGPADVKAMFGTGVDFAGDNRVIFDMGGNKYRLIARVVYSHGRVLIKFVGTHSDYDRIDPETA